MADQKVLDAQKWVNATYGSVKEYDKCPENGKVGWSTMYSLLYGLQHELGITTLAASFGPTTKNKLAALGDITLGWKKNANIVKIIQHALFCKGYWGANSNEFGTFGATTNTAIKKIQADMGITVSGKVTPDIFRCLLNMDAYVLVTRGSTKVRDIQRWLNSRYFTKSAFSIGPADGIYSRDVQKALMIALQYEMGISAPTGAFGPSTQETLKKNILSEGSQGVLVQLFSAACVFNEPVPADISKSSGNSEQVFTNMRSVWDSSLTIFVKAFQSFSQLPQTGKSDYQTWAQLLVSMGDFNRKVHGCDTRFEITEAKASWLKNNGYKVVGRYLYNPPVSPGTVDLNKNIKPGELERLFKYGLSVMPIFQDNGRRLEDFTYSQGYQHALKAHSLAEGFGFNSGTTIYFAVDYDATQDDINSNIIPYFNGIVAGLAYKGGKYFHGVYGSRNVCINVTNYTYARFSYVSGMSWAFSGNLGFPLPQNWSMNQINEISDATATDGEFDLDMVDWRLTGGDPGQSSINKPKTAVSDFVNSINKLYDLALSYKNGDIKAANYLVCQFYRKDRYNDYSWALAIGGIDETFNNLAISKGINIVEYVVDPVTGYQIDTQHLMASLQGHIRFEVPTNTVTGLVNEGDLLGWGGDLFTFYKDWRTVINDYPSGYNFCVGNLGSPGYFSSFGFSDLMADADSICIAHQIKTLNLSVKEVIRNFYQTGSYRTRFVDFWNLRFHDGQSAKKIVHEMLTAKYNPAILAGRAFFTFGTILPDVLDKDSLDDFEQGFVDALLKNAVIKL